MIGCCLIYLFVWLTGIVAAIPVPEFLQPYSELVISYYSNTLIVLFSSMLALVILWVMQKGFTLFTKQNCIYLTLPIMLFLLVSVLSMSFALNPLLCAAVPTLLIAALQSKDTVEVR